MKLRERVSSSNNKKRHTNTHTVHCWFLFIASILYFMHYMYGCDVRCECTNVYMCKSVCQYGKGYSLSDPLLHYDVFLFYAIIFYNKCFIADQIKLLNLGVRAPAKDMLDTAVEIFGWRWMV